MQFQPFAYFRTPPPTGGGGGGYVTENLEMYYDYGNTSSYPGSGTTVYDLISNTAGTITNGTYSSSEGGYMDFAAGGYVDTTINMNTLLTNNTSWTFEAWYSRPEYNSTTGFNNFLIGGVASTISTIFVYSNTGTDFGANVYNGGDSYLDGLQAYMSKNQFNQLVFVGNATSNVKVYINTVEAATGLGGFKNLFANQTVALPGRADIGDRWQGKFSIGRLYSAALTTTQITQNFNADKARYGL
jgi:hypothetical protein